MKRFAWAAPLLILAACGKDPVAACEDYIAAANDCISESAGTATTGAATLDASAFCQAYDGLKGDDAKTAVDAFDCATAAYGAADCSDPTAVADAATEAGTCILGG